MKYSDNNGNEFELDKLLPCPCCDGESVITYKGNDRTKKRSVTIKCEECQLQRTDAAVRFSQEWCAGVAVEQWNKRIKP